MSFKVGQWFCVFSFIGIEKPTSLSQFFKLKLRDIATNANLGNLSKAIFTR